MPSPTYCLSCAFVSLGADLNIGSKRSGRLFHRHLNPTGKDTRSKICINPEYLWTGRGPEMHNDFSRLTWKSKQMWSWQPGLAARMQFSDMMGKRQ